MKYYVIHTYGDIEPFMYGPYKSNDIRDKKAISISRKYPDDGIYKVEITSSGALHINTYTGDILQRHST